MQELTNAGTLTNEGTIDERWRDAVNWKNVTIHLPDPNLSLLMADNIIWVFSCKRTIANRLKYCLFCKFFPFTIKEWK